MVIKVFQNSSFGSIEDIEKYNEEKEESEKQESEQEGRKYKKVTQELDASHEDEKDLKDQMDFFNMVGEDPDNQMLHIMVSFSPTDRKLRDSTLKKILAEILDKLGLEDQPYKAWQHKDEDHQHFHLLVPKLVDPQQEKLYTYFYRINQLAKELTKKYKLNDKEKVTDILEFDLAVKRAELSEEVMPLLEDIVKKPNITSYKKLNEFLKKYNLKSQVTKQKKLVFYRISPLTGRKIPTRVFDKNRNVSHNVRMSVSLDSMGYNRELLEQFFKENRERQKQIQKDLKKLDAERAKKLKEQAKNKKDPNNKDKKKGRGKGGPNNK